MSSASLVARQGPLARGEKPPSRAAWEPGFLDDVAFAVDTDRAFACRPWQFPEPGRGRPIWVGAADLAVGSADLGRLDERRQARPAEPGVGREGTRARGGSAWLVFDPC